MIKNPRLHSFIHLEPVARAEKYMRIKRRSAGIIAGRSLTSYHMEDKEPWRTECDYRPVGQVFNNRSAKGCLAGFTEMGLICSLACFHNLDELKYWNLIWHFRPFGLHCITNIHSAIALHSRNYPHALFKRYHRNAVWRSFILAERTVEDNETVNRSAP